jgi:hypothetical protein
VSRWSGVLIGIAISSGIVFAQRGGPAGMSRDPAATPPAKAGANRLAGRVLDGETGQPLRRALVHITMGNLQQDRWTRTEIDGRWEFVGVLPGAYTVTASRDGFVTMAFGQKGPFGTSVAVRIPAEPGLDQLDIQLNRGGVIIGTISDEFGDPVGRAGVQAMRVKFVEGQRRLVPVAAGVSGLASGGWTLTDDRGEYRLFGLAPGTYYVSAMYGTSVAGQSDDRSTYPQTYYPGTPSVAEARPLAVTTGEPSAASFGLTPTHLSVVSGRVLNSAGQPSAANVRMAPVAPGHAVIAANQLTGRTDGRGAFTINGVPIGDYFLEVRGTGAGPELASYQVGVSGQDVRDLLLTTTPAGNLSGRLVLDASSGMPPSRGFYLQAVPLEAGAVGGRGLGRQSPTVPNIAGGLAIGELLGRYLLRFSSAPDGWWLKSVTLDGRDVTDIGIDIPGGQTVGGIEVVATQRTGSLTGVVVDVNGTRESDYSVVAFAPDEARWGPRTRFVVSDTSREDGTFSLHGLPPGEYVVVAVAPLEVGEEMDPERLARWRSMGPRITLADGEARSIALSMRR